ncbi:hypothetical protein MBLNU459_g7071t1 [Dothideomycetes sp. NU459]
MTMPPEMGGMGEPAEYLNDKVAGYDVNEEFIRKAVNEVSANPLRLALLQITKDKELEHMTVTKKAIRGGVLFDYVLSESDEQTVRAKAVAYLLLGPRNAPAPPSKTECFRLMDLFSDKPMRDQPGDPSFDYEEGYEELALENYPRDVDWTSTAPSTERLSEWKVIIVGAGISGLAAAIPLKKLGIPFEIIERQGGIGGTWLLNSYPGARVDTTSFLFQYKFEKAYPWTEYFASAGETRKYLEYVATKYGVKSSIKFNREVVAAKWESVNSKWHVQIRHKDGTEESLVCNAIISASGLFSTPNALPDIKGLSTFKGPLFHTAQWDHSVDHRNKDVALIGTGSTGAQLAPVVARESKSLTVYQRTPNWMFQIEGYRNAVSDHMHWLCNHLPYFWNWHCWATFYRSLHLAATQLRDEEWTAKGGKINKRNDTLRRNLTEMYEKEIGDRPDLMEKMMPTYAPMVRRLVVDNGFLACLKSDNVELVSDDIDSITETGILTKDGRHREFDIIVLGAGFKVSQYLWPVDYIGREGMTLAKAWAKDGARSYLGLTMPHYPNLFTLYGPNHQPRGGSLYSYGEMWARYAVASIVGMIERDVKSMEVRDDVFQQYQENLDKANEKLIWESNGSSYYVNGYGRQAVNMPWTTAEYHSMIRKPNFDDYNML